VAAKKTLIIDNYDSFTYNLYQYIGELGGNPVVKRNDAVTVAGIRELAPTHIIISPGPGDPADPAYFGVNREVILELSKSIPTLGVCLGHQGICFVLGGRVVRAEEIMHGKTSEITHDGTGLFAGIASPMTVMRYHSLITEKASIPAELRITALEKKSDIVMAVAHKTRPLYGVQFHPESIGTPAGKKLLSNFLNLKIQAPNIK
jgi:anthranilate synthase/aminodeoxychorismate synthase-like glutamine amidotransferase